MNLDATAPIAVRAAAPAELIVPDVALGLTWLPLSPDEAPELAELVGAIEEADRHPFRTSPQEVADWFVGAWRDNQRDTLAGRDPDGALRAYAQVTVAPGAERVVRAFLSGGVHPGWRGRGVGRALITWMEGRGRQLLAASGRDLPARIGVYLDRTDDKPLALYGSAGFTPVRNYADMRRSLALPLPAGRIPAGIRIVPWSPALDERVRLAHNETFADHWGSEPRTVEVWSQRESTFAPQWSLVALDEARGEVAGYLLSARYEHDWRVVGHSAGYIDVLGVRRPWRGRGLAVSLMASAMAAYRADGIEYAEISVDTENLSGAHLLYERLGFEVFHGAVLMTIEL